MFVAYNCNCYSTAPLIQNKNNEIFQEITPEDEFTENTKDDRIYLDMRRSKGYTDELEKLNHDDSGLAVIVTFKKAATKRMRLIITGFSQAEYYDAFSNKGYITTYTIITIIFHHQMSYKQIKWIKRLNWKEVELTNNVFKDIIDDLTKTKNYYNELKNYYKKNSLSQYQRITNLIKKK